MEEENKIKKGDNPKGQGPCKPKKIKTKEEKEAQRAKQAEKKRLKKEEAARKEAEAKLKAEGGQIADSAIEIPKENGESKKKEESKKNENKNNEKKENTKKRKYKIFGLTTYEERIEKLNEEEKNQNTQKNHPKENLSLIEIIEFLSKNAQYSKVNDELIISLRNIFLCGSSKQTSNCINLLNSLIKLIDTLSNDDKKDDKICLELTFLIKKIQELLSCFSEKYSGIYNTLKYLQLLSDNILSELSEKLKTYKITSEKLKDIIIPKIGYFIEKRVKKLVSKDENINIKLDIIKDDETILLFGKSKIFRKILLKAKNDNIRFKIIFVDSPKRNQFSTEIEFFHNLGIPVTLTYISGVYHLMQKVSKIFIKADALLANGDLIGKNGVSILASIAKIYNVPVYAFCPFFKFMNKIKLSNEPKTVEQGEFKRLIFDYDITPANLINDIICDNGFICSSSIPIYIKEIEEQDLNFINEKKYKLEMQ